MKIVNVSGTLEALIAECVGDAPEAVATKDWRGISLRLLRRLEESRLRIISTDNTPRERFTPRGPVRAGEHVLVVCIGSRTSIVSSKGAPLDGIPAGLARQLWGDMLDNALTDIGALRRPT